MKGDLPTPTAPTNPAPNRRGLPMPGATMTDDERQAEIVIKQWIHKVTGVSESERSMGKMGEAFRRLGESINEAFAPFRDFIEKGAK